MPNNSQTISLSEARARRDADRQSPIQFGSLPVRAFEFAGSASLSQPGKFLRFPTGSDKDDAATVLQAVEFRPRGLVDGFVKTCQRWMLGTDDQATLLGYKANETGAHGILSGRVNIPSEDVRDRMASVLTISLTLGALFDESADSEVTWLKTVRPKLQGKSSLDLLLTGKMTGLLTVLQLARAEREP